MILYFRVRMIFFFLILESNVGLYHKYLFKWVIVYKNKESRIINIKMF